MLKHPRAQPSVSLVTLSGATASITISVLYDSQFKWSFPDFSLELQTQISSCSNQHFLPECLRGISKWRWQIWTFDSSTPSQLLPTLQALTNAGNGIAIHPGAQMEISRSCLWSPFLISPHICSTDTSYRYQNPQHRFSSNETVPDVMTQVLSRASESPSLSCFNFWKPFIRTWNYLDHLYVNSYIVFYPTLPCK